MAYDKIVAADDASYQLPPLVRGTIEANLRNPATGEGDAVQDVADSRITVARQNGILSPNYIINGAFEINQRAFSSSTSSDAYGFDRWRMGSAGGTVTYSSQTFTLGSAPVAGYEGNNFIRVVTTGQSAAGNFALLTQRMENVRTLAGQTVTVSFWAKANSGTPKVVVELQQNFGSGGSPSSTVFVNAGQVTLSTSWARYSVTGAVPAIAGKTIGTDVNSSFLALQFFVSAGSDFNARTGSLGIQNNTFDIWGVQLEEGSVATPFRRNANSIQAELAACQRYFYNPYYEITAINTSIASAYTLNTVDAYVNIKLPVSMRAQPSITGITPSNFYLGYGNLSGNWQISTMTLTTATRDFLLILTSNVSAGMTGDRNAMLYRAGSTAVFPISAEL